jgi:hypothetical protein
MEQLRKTCVKILGADTDWPKHGNVPFAIAVALQLRVIAIREARAEIVHLKEQIDHENIAAAEETALRLRIPPDEQAKYGATSATEREAQIARAKLYIRSDRYVSNPTKPPPRTQDFIAWLDAALAALDELRGRVRELEDEIARLRADAGDTEVNYARELSRMKAEIARLHAPPEADVMERAHKVISDWRPDWPIAAIGDATKLIQILICALTAYGDQRAREGAMRAAIRNYNDADEEIIRAKREARAAAIEEAAQLCDDLWVGNPGKSVLAPKIRDLKSLKVKS